MPFSTIRYADTIITPLFRHEAAAAAAPLDAAAYG